MSVFEAIMLICFGIAWPVSIYKSWKSRTAKGKSVFFSYFVLAGYLSGMLHKYLYDWDVVFFLYLLNFLMVGTDVLLYYRNRKLDIALEKPARQA